MKRDKVLILRPHAATIGGVEHYYNVLALDALDPRFEYLQVTQPAPETVLGVGTRLLALYVTYWRRLRSGAYRLVLLNPSLNRNSFYRDAAFLLLARMARCEVAVFFRGWSDEMETLIGRRSLPRLIFKLTFARAPTLIVLSQTFCARLRALGCSPEARFHLASTVADDRFLPLLDLDRRLTRSAPLRILFMSRLVPTKGAALAVQAFAIARARLPDFPMTLTIAGDGPELPALRALVNDLGLSDVIFAGAVVGDNKGKLLTECDVFLLPTAHGEGMPNVILEALLYGMPVLSRPVGGISDVVEHGVNGFLSAELSPGIFAEMIVRLARDPQLRTSMSLANNRKALASYTTERARDTLLDIIEQTLAVPRERPSSP